MGERNPRPCRTWVHDPLKLLLALRGRLRTFSLCVHAEGQHRARIREAPRGRRKKRPPPHSRETRPRRKYEARIFGRAQIYRVSNTSLNFLAVKQKSEHAGREICRRLRKRMRMWESRVNFRVRIIFLEARLIISGTEVYALGSERAIRPLRIVAFLIGVKFCPREAEKCKISSPRRAGRRAICNGLYLAAHIPRLSLRRRETNAPQCASLSTF